MYAGSLPPFPGRVAVKAVRPDVAAGRHGNLLRKELDIMLSLDHPHILPLLDSYSRALPGGAAAADAGAEYSGEPAAATALFEHYLVTPLMSAGSLHYQLRADDAAAGGDAPSAGVPPDAASAVTLAQPSAGSGLLNDGPVRLRVALGIAEGLAYLHSRKIYHRDLKPQNIVRRQPRVAAACSAAATASLPLIHHHPPLPSRSAAA